MVSWRTEAGVPDTVFDPVEVEARRTGAVRPAKEVPAIMIARQAVGREDAVSQVVPTTCPKGGAETVVSGSIVVSSAILP
jgi:hypothetical protein